MREAVGEANISIVTIILVAIVVTAGTTIFSNVTNGMKTSDSVNCAKYGYSYDKDAKKCRDVNGNIFDMPGIGEETPSDETSHSDPGGGTSETSVEKDKPDGTSPIDETDALSRDSE